MRHYPRHPMNFPVVTICGSMRFFERMMEVARIQTASGWIVLMPFVVKDNQDVPAEMLDEMHLHKIRMADTIVVVTNSERYIGESTQKEIDYASSVGKPVFFDTGELVE